MKVRSKARALLLVVAGVIAGIVVVPGVAAAKDALTEVIIKNTPANPVPVAPQGTTQVNGSVSVTNPITGTVTVANPTPAPPPAPVPVQGTFDQKEITRANPFAGGVLYEVPAGKTLIVEFFQAHWLFSGVGLRQAQLLVSCNNNAPGTNPTVFLQEQDSGLGYHVVGGATRLHVPGGSCLRYSVGAISTDIGEGTTLFMYGHFTGQLIDAAAPAAA